jgi:hypothetical protein
MSPTYGKAPPSLGAADLHVDPQALWDVGLALQRVRDAAESAYRSAAEAVVAVGGIDGTDDLQEIREAWLQLSRGLGDVDVGLARQLLSLVGVVDASMIKLRTTIEEYVSAEAQSRVRLGSIGQAGG